MSNRAGNAEPVSLPPIREGDANDMSGCIDLQLISPSSLTLPRNRTLSILVPIYQGKPSIQHLKSEIRQEEEKGLALLPLPSTETSPPAPAAFLPPCLNIPRIWAFVLCLALTAASFNPPSSSASSTSASSSSLISAGDESLMASWRGQYTPSITHVPA